jgi:hypothetical protein
LQKDASGMYLGLPVATGREVSTIFAKPEITLV